ncbi:MAG: cation transporter [Clostridia bacterium]|nr:cation transporter [Clostridia bacterium]
MKKSYKIEVDCPNCANKMEQAAAKTEGVKSASVSFMTLRMTVEFADGADEKTVMAQVL